MKNDFFNYIGSANSLSGYSRSYKLVFYKCFFNLMDSKHCVSTTALTTAFKNYYLNRKQTGLITDKDVDFHIENIENSSDQDIYKIILNNPYKHISERNYILKDDSKGLFYLAPELANELTPKDIQKIQQLVDSKINLYFSKIDSTASTGLHNLFDRVLNEYTRSIREPFANHPMGKLFRNELVNTLYEHGIDKNLYLIKGSTGQGNWVTVPWLAIFDRTITTSATQGVYIVYLLSSDGQTLYLTLNQGCTALKKQVGKAEAIRQMRAIAQEVTRNINCKDFDTASPISLGSNLPDLAQLYEFGCICFKKYTQKNVPDDTTLLKDLFDMIDIYKQYALKPNGTLPTISFWKISHGNNVFTDTEKEYYEKKRLAVVSSKTKTKAKATISQGEDFMQNMKSGDIFYLCYGNHIKFLCRLTTDELISCSEKGNDWYGRPYEIITSATNQVPYNEKAFWWAPNNNSTCIHIPSNDLSKFEELILKPYFNTSIEEITKQEVTGGKEMTMKETLESIKNYIYENGLIEDFYLSLKSKPFVILAGISGTGKTRLVKLFAEAIGATSSNGRFKLVPVRPDWSDSTDLFGHLDLNGNFVPGAIIDFVKKAELDNGHPYFLCLDEMNLARVEYYLSDILSVIETRDFDSTGRIVSTPLITDTYFGTAANAARRYGNVLLPENLYIIGTVNMDETTFPFSRKVLDRANTIEFSHVNLIPPDFETSLELPSALNLPNTFLKTEYLMLAQCHDENTFILDLCYELNSLNKILETANVHVGYRVRDEIVFYMVNNKKFELLSRNEALDYEIMQKILPRIQGNSSAIKHMLCDLFKFCAGDYEGYQTDNNEVGTVMLKVVKTSTCKYQQSATKIAFMVRRYEEDGFTSYWI